MIGPLRSQQFLRNLMKNATEVMSANAVFNFLTKFLSYLDRNRKTTQVVKNILSDKNCFPIKGRPVSISCKTAHTSRITSKIGSTNKRLPSGNDKL